MVCEQIVLLLIFRLYIYPTPLTKVNQNILVGAVRIVLLSTVRKLCVFKYVKSISIINSSQYHIPSSGLGKGILQAKQPQKSDRISTKTKSFLKLRIADMSSREIVAFIKMGMSADSVLGFLRGDKRTIPLSLIL